METTVNERLMAIMNKYGLNPYSFSKRIDVAKSTVSEYFKDGSTREPSLSILQKVTAAFVEISPIWIYEGKGEMYISKCLSSDEKQEKLLVQVDDLQEIIAKQTKEIADKDREIAHLNEMLDDKRKVIHFMEAEMDMLKERIGCKKEIV